MKKQAFHHKSKACPFLCVGPDSYAVSWLQTQMDQKGLALLNQQHLQIREAWNIYLTLEHRIKYSANKTQLLTCLLDKATPETVAKVNIHCTNIFLIQSAQAVCKKKLSINWMWHSRKTEGYFDNMDMRRKKASGYSRQQSNKQRNKKIGEKRERH